MKKCIYKVLKNSLINNMVTYEQLADAANISLPNLDKKLSGKEPFYPNEAKSIQLTLFEGIPLDVLFSTK